MDKINTKLPYEGYCVSRQGGRSENQDTCGYVDTPYGLLVVICDGMGGGPAGKTASMLAVEVILNAVKLHVIPEGKKIDRKEVLTIAIKKAEQAIINYQEENPAVRGMGTTVVALLINDESAVIAHVGDSRCYQLRFGRKKFRTEDHSFVGNLVRTGQITEEQARLSSQSNIITRALSGRCSGEPTIDVVGFEKGDRFILCTDGVWGMMPEPTLLKRMAEKTNLPLLAEKLAADIDDLGRQNGGGHDNLTLSIIKTKGDSKYKEPMTRKYRFILIVLSVISFLCILFGLFGQCGKTAALNEKDKQIEVLEKELARLRNVDNKLGVNLTNTESVDFLNRQISELVAQNDSLVRCLGEAKERLLKQDKKSEKSAKSAEVIKSTTGIDKDLKDLSYLRSKISTIPKQKSTANAKKIVKDVLPSLKDYAQKYKNTSVGKYLDDAIEKMSVSCTTDARKKDRRQGQVNAILESMDKAIKDLKKKA